MLSVRIARNLSKLTGKLCTLSGNFPDCSETFQTIWKLSRLSGNFPDCPETFRTIPKLSRLTGNFSDCPETFQSVRKTFQTFRTLSGQSGNFVTFSIVHASFNGHFFYIRAKTLFSGRARTFWSAMQTRRQGFWDSVPSL